MLRVMRIPFLSGGPIFKSHFFNELQVTFRIMTCEMLSWRFNRGFLQVTVYRENAVDLFVEFLSIDGEKGEMPAKWRLMRRYGIVYVVYSISLYILTKE